MIAFMILQGMLALLCFAHCGYLIYAGQYKFLAVFFLCGLLNAWLTYDKWRELRKQRSLTRIIEERY